VILNEFREGLITNKEKERTGSDEEDGASCGEEGEQNGRIMKGFCVIMHNVSQYVTARFVSMGVYV